MVGLIIFIIIVSTAVGIWLKNKTQQRSNDRSDRLQQKQEDLINTLKEKIKQHGN